MAIFATVLLLSWNINGVKAASKKGLWKCLRDLNPDFVLFQEIRAEKPPIEAFTYPAVIWNPAARKGSWGTALLSTLRPLKVKLDPSKDEGRTIIADFDYFVIINAYFPHPGRSFENLKKKLEYGKSLLEIVMNLNKPFILAGDFNVAASALDLARPRENKGRPMFSREERQLFKEFLRYGRDVLGLCIRRKGSTHGGPMATGHTKETSGGASIISLLQRK